MTAAPSYSQEICTQDHAGQVSKAEIEALPSNETHPFRHRCAGCAYAAGMNEAGGDIAALVAQVKQLTDENAGLRTKLETTTN